MTIDNPPLNLITMALRNRIAELATGIDRRSDIRALVLTSTGDRAFSGGSDVRELPRDPAAGMRRARAEHEAYRQVRSLPQPIIAALRGHVIGGGLELALLCDLRVADDTVQIGFPEVRLGLFPAAGGSQRLPRLIGAARAKELMLLGESVDAAEALRLGIVNRVVPAGQAFDVALELAQTIAELPAMAVRAIKLAVDGGLEEGSEGGGELERELIARLYGSQDAREGVSAFLEKRQPRFRHR